MRRALLLCLLGATAIGTAVATASCAMSDSDCSFDGTCAGGDGGGATNPDGSNIGEGGIAEAAAPPANCNATADPKDPSAAACIDDTFALFVNVSANAGGDGTKEKPFTKINDALAKVASTGKKRIYICGAATYPEHVAITNDNAAWLIGGMDCNSWAATSGANPKVLPSDAGYALQITGVTGPLKVEDIAFEALAGTKDKSSSIAAFASTSPNVAFTRVALAAHDGFEGANGEAGSTGGSSPSDLTGSTASGNAGGAAKTCTCTTGGTSVGAKGGDVVGAKQNGDNGQPIIQQAPPTSGAGQTQADCNAEGGSGKVGANAPAATDAQSPTVGSLTETGWNPGDGATGQPGGPGQGGGGGGSNNVDVATSGGGGGGGCGGCGGSGGTGGTAGGSSLALATFNAPIQLNSCNLTSGSGAKGGNGQAGGSGASGGAKGTQVLNGCPGGAGGRGGDGGGGAGGAGGMAVAILYKGDQPKQDSATVLTAGTHGTGGTGGATTTPNGGPNGQDGKLVAAP